MLPSRSTPCRSPRLLGKSVDRINSQLHENERTHKKPRLSNSSKRSRSSPSQSKRSDPSGITILSLPDDTLRLIFIHLGVCRTSGSFVQPRHAFQLAQANKRLLRLFGSLLTHITPFTEFNRFIDDTTQCLTPDYTPLTLSSQHLLSAVRSAGQALQELHLPRTSFKNLPTICSVCPGLKVLSVVSDPDVTTNVLTCTAQLSLRSLSITGPSRDHLDSLVPTPSELSLIKMNYRDIEGLASILRDPPKTFNLGIFDFDDGIDKSMVSNLLQYLEVAIPKMESVSVSVSCRANIAVQNFPDEAADLIGSVRKNDEQSTCMSLSLDGCVLFGLVTKANKNAKIELTQYHDTIAGHGDGIYTLASRPRFFCFHDLRARFDFSRLREVAIYGPFNSQWKQIISGVRLKKAFIQDPHYAVNMSISVETLEMPVSNLKGRKWKWLSNVRYIVLRESKEFHVRTLNPRDVSTARISMFKSLASLLQQFRGDTVWIDCINVNCLKPKKYGYCFTEAVKATHAGAERFEKRGGDAGTVKTLAAEIMTRWRR